MAGNPRISWTPHSNSTSAPEWDWAHETVPARSPSRRSTRPRGRRTVCCTLRWTIQWVWSVRGNQSAHLLVGVAFQALHKQFIVSIDEGIYNTGGLHRTGEDTPLEDTSTSPTNIKAPPPPKKKEFSGGVCPGPPYSTNAQMLTYFTAPPPILHLPLLPGLVYMTYQ